MSSASSSPFLSMGADTFQIPLSMFADNRQRLIEQLPEESIVYLTGGPSPTRFDTDHEPVFRQESYFFWLTGVKEPDCSVIVQKFGSNGDSKAHCTLLIPELPASYATIMGKIRSLTEWKDLYKVDATMYTHQADSYLEGLLSKSDRTQLLLLEGKNTDSGNIYSPPTFQSELLQTKSNSSLLFPVLAECRVIKSQQELALLEHVAQISSFAHAYVMRNVKPGMMEYQCESLFRHYAYYNYGCRLVSYTSICGCGPNAAILHYGHAGEPNSRQIGPDDNCLFDQGAEYQCYASDITCSFPANGKFSDKFLPIYMGVLNAQIAVYELAKPGVSYVDCHKAAELEILKALEGMGIVIRHNETLEQLVEKRLGAVFMPHGLGHFIGLDTHDVGGYLDGHPERSALPGLKSLRTSRILKENMTLTVEPGLYFIDHLLDEALCDPDLSKHLDKIKLEAYRGYGGCRLEDVVQITKDGLVNFTVAPRTVQEVEFVMAGGMWPPTKDEAPELRRLHLTKPVPLGPPPSL